MNRECDNPDLQPEFVRLDASAEDAVQADGVGDDKADDNRPQHILDVRHGPMLVVRKVICHTCAYFPSRPTTISSRTPGT
jgi:hypothetical protein